MIRAGDSKDIAKTFAESVYGPDASPEVHALLVAALMTKEQRTMELRGQNSIMPERDEVFFATLRSGVAKNGRQATNSFVKGVRSCLFLSLTVCQARKRTPTLLVDCTKK